MQKLKGKDNDCTTLQAKTDVNRQRITVVESHITIGIDCLWNYKLLSLHANNKPIRRP